MAGLREVLKDLVKMSGVTMAVITGYDGLVIDGVAPGRDVDPEYAAATMSEALGGSLRLGRDLNMGMLQRGMLEYGTGLVVVSSLGDDGILFVVSDTLENLGIIRHEVKRCTPLLAQALQEGDL
jgi:predicted regulator of Ras-like GTPase activity (Roadblock/LC7/MglB family)